MNSQPDFEKARQYAVYRLQTQLPPWLVYHSVVHTVHEVLPAAERFARAEGVTPDAMFILRTAVLFHDIGFTVQHENHESISAHIAGQALPGFGYNDEQIRAIIGLILVTRLFTTPQDPLEAILLDADLDVLGRTDFLTRNKQLRAEMASLGKVYSDEQWFSQQLKFMQIHTYRTAAAQRLRGPGKVENIHLVENLLEIIAARESLLK